MSADASRLIAGIERWGAEVHRRSVQGTPRLVRHTGLVPQKDGELWRSIRAEPWHTAGGGVYRGRIAAPVIQAVTTDKGARPHVITPRRAGGVLVFHWPKAGGTVFLRRVNHPGNPPRPWWRQAVMQAYREALRNAARSLPL